MKSRNIILRASLVACLASIIVTTSVAIAREPRKKVRVCVGDEYWYPFSYVEDGVLKGVHLDLATMALNAAGFEPEFTAMPWARCADHESKNGTMDVPLSAGWREDRTAYLIYPPGAETDGPKCRSKYALMCNGHVVVVPAVSKFKFDGDLAKVPQPIRIVHGYTQVKEYQARGVQVDTGPNDESNLRKMLRDGTGSVLILIQSAQQFSATPELKNKFRIIENYADSGDSFMPFSKKGSVTESDANRVWEEIAKLRKYPVVIDNALRRHQKAKILQRDIPGKNLKTGGDR
jgi:hypothetical protein